MICADVVSEINQCVSCFAEVGDGRKPPNLLRLNEGVGSLFVRVKAIYNQFVRLTITILKTIAKRNMRHECSLTVVSPINVCTLHSHTHSHRAMVWPDYYLFKLGLS